jgi:alpha-tubulin suppressor-like RCC1 family protein
MCCHLNQAILFGVLCSLFVNSCMRKGFDAPPCDGGVKLDGACYVRDCPDRQCPEDFVCRDGECVELKCFDVVCGADEGCVKGVCYPKNCETEPCAGFMEVCFEGRCVSRNCVGVSCSEGEECIEGECKAEDPCLDDTTCANEHRVCVNQSGTVVCGACVGGYHDEGGACVVDQTCLVNSCSGHGSCDDTSGQVVCSCATGYAGTHCENCATGDVQWPASSGVCVDNPCDPDPCVSIGHGTAGTCVQTGVSSFQCACQAPYHWDSGACIECNVPTDCDDNNACTTEECNDHGCGHANNNGFGCDDGNACTQTDTCQGGVCIGANPVFCVARDQCHDAGTCDTGTGICSNPQKAEGTACEDLLYCNGTDTCDGSGGCSLHSGNLCGVLSCDEDKKQCVGNGIGLGLVSISSHGDHTCGLTTDGVAYCWGRDNFGQLGNGGTGQNTKSPSPVDTSAISGNKAFVELAEGWLHTCGLTAEGVAYCWGNDEYGQLGNGGGWLDTQSPFPVDTSTITGNKAFVQLTAGNSHTCGLTAEGVAYCWGWDGYGQLGNGGASQDSQSPCPVNTSAIPGNKAFVQLAGGGAHTCGLTAEGVAYCWGYDGDGELGNGGGSLSTQSPSLVDTSTIPGNKAFIQLAGGGYHTCGLTAEGVATCWGYDNLGQLGNGGGSLSTQSPCPVDTSTMSGNKLFIQLTAGNTYHTCGLTSDGVAYCWGNDGNGQLGNGGVSLDTQSPSPVDTSTVPGNKAFIQLTGGGYHTCGLTAGGVAYCWGYDGHGELGNGGTSVDTQSPSPVDTSATPVNKAFVKFTGGYGHTCALTSEGVAHCWGTDLNGQLGNGFSSQDEQSPSLVDTSTIFGNKAFVQLTGGGYHTCGLTVEGVAYCWGTDLDGQLGNGGTSQNTQSPSLVDTSTIPGNKVFVQLTGGGYHTCGLAAEGVIYCWGKDQYGQLGTGGISLEAQSPSLVDTSAIPGINAFVQIAGGYGHTCGLTAEGVVYCWGWDGYGQLGNGGTSQDTQSPSPVDTSTIPGNKAFVKLTGGNYHTCGLTAEGVAYCWGLDQYGQLGNGGATLDAQSPSPVDTSAIPGNKAFVQLTAGWAHTCGLTADGVAYCWGYDFHGELGNGGGSVNTQGPTPVDTSTVPGNKAFALLTGGNYHTCGLTVDGVATCWGWDVYGQLGNGGSSLDTQSPSLVDTSGI